MTFDVIVFSAVAALVALPAMVTVNFGQVKGEEDFGGDWKCKPGRYHVVCLGCDDGCETSDSVLAEFLVLDGTTPKQTGKRVRDWLPLSKKAEKKLHRAILCLGLMEPGKKGDVDFADARGAELVIEIEEQDYQGKTQSKVSFVGYWRTSSPDVVDVPRGKAPNEEDLPAPWWEEEDDDENEVNF